MPTYHLLSWVRNLYLFTQIQKYLNLVIRQYFQALGLDLIIHYTRVFRRSYACAVFPAEIQILNLHILKKSIQFNILGRQFPWPTRSRQHRGRGAFIAPQSRPLLYQSQPRGHRQDSRRRRPQPHPRQIG